MGVLRQIELMRSTEEKKVQQVENVEIYRSTHGYEAQRITGVNEKAVLIREGLKALIERESSRRLSALGATEPELEAVPRRRSAK